MTVTTNIVTDAAVRKVKPPYARELERSRQAGESPNLHVHMGVGAWDRAKHSIAGNRLVVPVDVEHGIDDFDYSVTKGLTVVLNAIGADPVLACRAAEAMCVAGALMVVVISPELPANSQFYYAEAQS